MAVALMAAVALAFPPGSGTVRYRVDIVVETADRQRIEASGVWELTIQRRYGLGNSSAIYSVRGDAIPVSLSNGPTLFALRRSAGSQGSGSNAGHYPALCAELGLSTDQYFVDMLNFQGPCRISVPGNFPTLVYFPDRSAPSRPLLTADADDTRVPAQGRGARIIAVTATRTAKPINRPLDELLPWISDAPTEGIIDDGGIVATPYLMPNQYSIIDLRR